MDDCLFCRIAQGKIPADIRHRDAQVVAFADLDPQAPMHLLIIPVTHIASAAELEAHPEVAVHLLGVASRLAQGSDLAQGGYRLVTNVGPDAGQSVHHLHWHLLAGRKFGWPPG